MTNWYVFGTDLTFSNFFILFSLGIDHDPHVLYVYMTHVYSISYVPFLTRSHGQEKSLSYYDLFDLGVLFYGRIPTFIFLFLLNHPTPILAIDVLVIRTDLEENVRQPQRMEKRKILGIRWRTMFSPD